MTALHRTPPATLLRAFGPPQLLIILLSLVFFPSLMQAQEIEVRGGSSFTDNISNGQTSTSNAEGTDFGSENVTGGAQENSFRIKNTNSSDFNPLNDLVVTGVSVTTTTSSTTASPHFSVVSGGIATMNGQATHQFTVRFNPTSSGTKTATVRIFNNDSNEAPFTFRVRGVGVGVPEIQVTGGPNILGDGVNISDGTTSTSTSAGTNFGTVNALLPDVSHTFRVRNSGTGTLTLSFSDGSSPHFRFSSTTTSVAPGNFDDFNIIFDPQQSGSLSATIRIDNNDANENPYTFRVAGTARAPEIQVLGGINRDDNITLGDPTPTFTERTNFGSIDVNDGPITRTFRIRNTEASDGNPATGNLIISLITEGSAHFSIPLQVYPPITEGGFFDFNVQFDPTAVGTFDTVLSISNNDIDGNENPYTFTIRGTGTGSPEIEVQGKPDPVGVFLNILDGDTTPEFPNGTHFGNLSVNAGSVSHQFRVRNTGSAPLTVSATESSAAFSISGLASTISPGGSDIFNISFNPTTNGAVSTDIIIDTNDPDDGEDPYTFRVTGTGTSPEIEVRGGTGFSQVILDGDPAPRTGDHTDFGPRDILAAPLNQTFQIRNTGNENLLIGSVTVDDQTHFAILPGVIAPIFPGGNATFTVGFDPAAVGIHTTQVRILHNDPDGSESPYNFTIRGEGTGSPEIEVFGNPLGPVDGVPISDGDIGPSVADGTSFGPLDVNLGFISHTFRIRNSGSTNLTVSINENAPAFSLSSVATNIAPGSADDFNIIFNPSSTGLQTTDIVITNNDPDGNENPYTFRVSGTGTGPDIGVAGGQFLSVPISDGDSTPRTEDHTDFGALEIGEEPPADREFRISNDAIDDGNPATQNLVIESIEITGTGADHFAIISLPIVLPLQEGNNASLVIRFNPTAAGVHEALVVIQNNDPEEDPYSFAIRGEATSSPEIRVFAFGIPPLLEILSGLDVPSTALHTDFGTPDINGPPTNRLYRITNSGNENLTLSATVVGDRDFQISGMARTIPPGGFDDFEIIFDPTSSGERSATITIDNNDPDDGEDPFTFMVFGEARAPEIAVFGGRDSDVEIMDNDSAPRSEDGTDFGEAEIGGDPAESLFLIRNLQEGDGLPLTGDLLISNIQLSGPGAEHFAIVPRFPFPIAEESFGTVRIRFQPTALGVHTATLTITHNDPDDREAPFNFDLVGVGTGEPEIEVFGLPVPVLSDGTPIANNDITPLEEDGTDFGFSDVYALIDRTHTFRIRNSGNAPLTVSVAEDSPQYQITESLDSTIPAGGFDDFNITYNPQVSGRHDAIVTVINDDPDDNEAPYTFQITGRAYAPEIEVRGGNTAAFTIESGDDEPEGNDGTAFGEVAVSSGAVEHTFQIFNLVEAGGTPFTGNLIISEFTISNPENFSIVAGQFPAPMPPGQQRFFVIRFDPSEAGLQTATVTIRHNDPDGNEDPYTFTVQGTGLGEPEIAVSGLPIPFITDGVPIANGDDDPQTEDGTEFRRTLAGSLVSDQANTFRIRNSGTAALHVSVTQDSDQFEITIPPVATIPALGFSDFTILFNPDQTGRHTATVTIANDDPTGNENPYTFDLSGVAWGPEITVRGGSNFERPIQSGDDTPNPIDFTDLGGSLFPGSIERTFRVHNLIRANGSPLSGNLHLFGISVSNPQVFSISAGAPLPLVPIIVMEENFHEFNVRFTPNAEGEFRGTVTILHNDPDGDENPFTFDVVGRAGDPELSLWGSDDFDREILNGDMVPSIADGTDFESYVIGSIQPPDPPLNHQFQIRNTGGSDLTVSLSSDSPEFTVPSSNLPVSPNNTFTWFVAFNPTSPGPKEATITITSNDPDENPYTFKVSGIALGPAIEVLGGPALDVPIANPDLTPELADRTDFGNVAVGAQRTHTFRVSNPGNLDLTVGVSFFGDPGDFTTGGLPAVVAPGTFEDFTITFAPTSTGSQTAHVEISNNGPEFGPYRFHVRGNGTPALPGGNQIASNISFTRAVAGGFNGRLEFQGQVGKTYRIVTTIDLETWEPIPQLTGLTGLGDLIGVDLSEYLPSTTNRTRFFRVEEE